MNDRRIDHCALAQQQASATQIAVDDLQNPCGQFMFLKQATEVEDGLVRDMFQAQLGELAQDGRLVQGLFHRRIAVAETVLRQMHPQHRHQRVSGRPSSPLG